MNRYPRYTEVIHSGYQNPSDRSAVGRDQGFYLKIAKISRVDYEIMCVDLIYMDSVGGYPNVPITAGYGSYRAFLGAMPQVGDWVIIGFAKGGGFNQPLIIQFIPRGYAQGIQNDMIGTNQVLIQAGLYQPIRFKMQKLYEGEIYGASKYGSEFLLDKNVSISNSKLNEIFIKAANQSINFNAVNLHQNLSGVRLQSGLIYRNALISHPLFQLFGNTRFPVHYDEDGVANYIPTYAGPINADNPYGRNTIDTPSQGFTEHRTEIKEMVYPIMGVTPFNSGMDVDSLYTRNIDGSTDLPLIVQVLGTLVGNDPAGDDGQRQYGQILRPSIFGSTVDIRGNLKEIPCLLSDGKNEITTLAAAYTLKLPNTGTAFYINKQGKYFANISSSSSVDPIGAGESAEINLAGHTRLYMGQNAINSRSFTFGTEGGVFTNWGFDNVKGRSWDATFRKGVSWNILGTDSDYIAFNLSVAGNTKTVINGVRYTEIGGNDTKIVRGSMTETIYGIKVENYFGDRQSNYAGDSYENVIGHCSQVCALGKSTNIIAPYITGDAESTNILLGNSTHNMLAGFRTKNIFVGADMTTTIFGTISNNVGFGEFSVTVGTGVISLTTPIGEISLTTGGMVSITGSYISATSFLTNIESPLITLGSAPTNAVVTSAFPCYITGLPHLGSVGVRCTPGLVV